MSLWIEIYRREKYREGKEIWNKNFVLDFFIMVHQLKLRKKKLNFNSIINMLKYTKLLQHPSQ